MVVDSCERNAPRFDRLNEIIEYVNAGKVN